MEPQTRSLSNRASTALEAKALIQSYFRRGFYSSNASTALEVEAMVSSAPSRESRSSRISAALLGDRYCACHFQDLMPQELQSLLAMTTGSNVLICNPVAME